MNIEPKQAPVLKPIQQNFERENPMRKSDHTHMKIKQNHRSSMPEKSMMEMIRPNSIIEKTATDTFDSIKQQKKMKLKEKARMNKTTIDIN